MAGLLPIASQTFLQGPKPNSSCDIMWAAPPPKEKAKRQGQSGRSMLRRYKGKGTIRRGLGWVLLLLGPGRGYAGHAGVGYQLAHVLVGVDDYAEIHAVYGGVAIGNVDFAVEVFRGDGGVGFFYGSERTLEPVDYVGFGGDALFHFDLEFGGHFRAGDAEEIEIGQRDVHVDLTRGTHTRRGTPGEFFFGGGFGQVDQLFGDVLPLAVVALPDSFGRGLRGQRTRRDHQQQQQNRFRKISSRTHAIPSRIRSPFYIAGVS